MFNSGVFVGKLLLLPNPVLQATGLRTRPKGSRSAAPEHPRYKYVSQQQRRGFISPFSLLLVLQEHSRLHRR